MWAEIKNLVKSGFEIYPMRKVGFLLGVIFGAAIMAFGILKTFFAMFCGVIGLYIGSRFEEGDDLVANTLRVLENLVPERFRYWKFFS